MSLKSKKKIWTPDKGGSIKAGKIIMEDGKTKKRREEEHLDVNKTMKWGNIWQKWSWIGTKQPIRLRIKNVEQNQRGEYESTVENNWKTSTPTGPVEEVRIKIRRKMNGIENEI